MKVKELIEELQKCNPEDYVKMGLHDIEYIAPMVDGGVFIGDCGYPRICPNCGNALVYTESFYGDFCKILFKMVKIEILKEDLELFNGLTNCKECKFFTTCNNINTHCIKLETIYTDYRICDEFDDGNRACK